LFFVSFINEQEKKAFKDGERLKFRMSYSGFLKAGEAEFTLKEDNYSGKKVFHAIGKGRTANVISWFFKVRDDYQSYFDYATGVPYLFKRRVDEGGYTIKRDLSFDQTNHKVRIQDLKKKKDTTITTTPNVQDMISTFYYLRKYDTHSMKPGDEINVNMFFDYELFPFKLKFLGFETINTPFGKVKTQKFSPLVQSGRVFKEKESVSVWISADDNKIPLKIKADLAVGSLRADLKEYEGLANSFDAILK